MLALARKNHFFNFFSTYSCTTVVICFRKVSNCGGVLQFNDRTVTIRAYCRSCQGTTAFDSSTTNLGMTSPSVHGQYVNLSNAQRASSETPFTYHSLDNNIIASETARANNAEYEYDKVLNENRRLQMVTLLLLL